MNEEVTRLNVFGKHPGYRKKSMTHPDNDEVAPNGARDWNDDSAKSQEPFGKQIGSSAPYTDKVLNILTDKIFAHFKKVISEDVDEKTFLRLPEQPAPANDASMAMQPEAQAGPGGVADAGSMPDDPAMQDAGAGMDPNAMGGDPGMMGGDPGAMGDPNAMGGEDPSAMGDDQFGGNFDAGVEADEDTDPENYIQQLTGKLSQSLKDYDDQNPGKLDLDKYVAGMIIKQAIKGMDEGERKKVIKKIKETPLPGDDQMEDASTEGVESDPALDGEMGGGEEPQAAPQEGQPMNERRSIKVTKSQVKKLYESINAGSEEDDDRRDSEYSKYVKFNKRTYPFIPPQFK